MRQNATPCSQPRPSAHLPWRVEALALVPHTPHDLQRRELWGVEGAEEGVTDSALGCFSHPQHSKRIAPPATHC